ncbi:hypothetical protein TNCV_4724351 [Trichonephila clavipes]|uniref:Retroviral polymerase SH3-like domain-containing protein n=1 Tax=Trichonephila clavipes TaxID=2585209 RepID=A0A8X6W790_TRICX|nr:hypothetical protein TNCV_4724351 [Trichonephila clavipes]
MELLRGSQHLTPQNKMEPVNEKCEPPLKWPEHSNIQILSSEEKENGQKKAIQRYLVGYDGDERYRIWLKKEHRVILSRDVIFPEKAGKCDDRTELKLEDRIRGDTNQGKYEEQLIKIEDNPIEKTLSQEDLSDSETDREADAGPTSDRQLTSAETQTV